MYISVPNRVERAFAVEKNIVKNISLFKASTNFSNLQSRNLLNYKRERERERNNIEHFILFGLVYQEYIKNNF